MFIKTAANEKKGAQLVEMPDSDEIKEMVEEPLLDNTNQQCLGGIRTLPFIIANEAFEKVANFGISADFILYLKGEYHMSMVSGTNIINFWTAATNFLPVLGAFVADSFVGRFSVIGFGCIVGLLNLAMHFLVAGYLGITVTGSLS